MRWSTFHRRRSAADLREHLALLTEQQRRAQQALTTAPSVEQERVLWRRLATITARRRGVLAQLATLEEAS